LKDDLQPSATDACSDQLVTIPVSLVPTNFVLRKEALHCFLETDAMISKLVALKIILEISRMEKMPVYQSVPSSSGKHAMFRI
jgi:hypothetical protein